MEIHDILKAQMDSSAKSLEVLGEQMNHLNVFLNQATSQLKGDDQQSVMILKSKLSKIFKKAQAGDMSFAEDLETVKSELLKRTGNGN